MKVSMTQANFERGLAVQQVTRLKHEIDELNRDRRAVGLYCHIVKRVCVCVCRGVKKLQEHLTEKIKPMTVSRRIRTGVRLSEIKRAAESSVFNRRLKAISDGDVMTSDVSV